MSGQQAIKIQGKKQYRFEQISAGIMALVMFVGVIILSRVEKTFMDTV
jgi:hypothetical protein